MRNTIKILAIVLAAVIVFGVTSCGDENDDDTISGNNIVSGADVVYDVSNLAEAKKATDFSYYGESNGKDQIGVKPLSYYLDGSPSVTVNNNKVTIILGTPKSNFLANLSDFMDETGVTVNPSNAKFFISDVFYTSDGKYELGCFKDGDYYEDSCALFYVDRDVTVKGKGTVKYENDEAPRGGGGYEEEATYNMPLKKGWNYVSVSYNEKTNTVTYTASTTQPSGYKWTITNNWNYDYYYYDDDDDYYYDDYDYDDDDD